MIYKISHCGRRLIRFVLFVGVVLLVMNFLLFLTRDKLNDYARYSVSCELKKIIPPQLLLTYKTVEDVLTQENDFDHCDEMDDVWTMTITFLKPLRLVYCPICKNMNTQMWALLTRTFHNKTFSIDKPVGLHTFWDFRWVQKDTPSMVQNAFGSKSEVLRSVDNFEYLVIIRHPFERFLSAFYHVCVMEKWCDRLSTNYCKTDIYCMIAYLEQLRRKCLWKHFGDSSLEMLHFVPQTYFCYLRKMKPNSLIVMHNNTKEFRESITDFLLRKGIPRETIFSGWGSQQTSWLNATTSHTTSDSFAHQRELVLANVTTLRDIFTVYQADFRMFRFSMPQSVTDHCEMGTDYYDPLCSYLRESQE